MGIWLRISLAGYLVLALGLAQGTRSFAATTVSDQDKETHFMLSACVGAGGYGLAREMGQGVFTSILAGVALAAFAGVAKETFDDHIDPKDLSADAAGAGVGILLSLGVDFMGK